LETVKLIENIFTFQGEGPDSGNRMLLLRFKKCDRIEMKIPCHYCDTLLKLRISDEGEYKLGDIQKKLTNEDLGILITGGEPLYDEYFESTLALLNLDYTIANVETNGYNIEKLVNRLPPDKNIRIIYSPKFFSFGGVKREFEIIKKISHQIFKNRIIIKVVAYNDDNILEFLTLIKSMALNKYTYLMPQGKTRDELLKNSSVVFDLAEEFKMNFSTRDHVIYEFI